MDALERLYGEPFGPCAGQGDRPHHRALSRLHRSGAVLRAGVRRPRRARLLAARRSRRASCGSPTRRRCSSRTGAATTASTRLRNIIRDPRVALLFLIPGCGETIRVNRPRRDLDRSGAGAKLRHRRQDAAHGDRRHGRAHLLSVRQGDRALEAVGRVAPCRAQEPAERRHDPRRSHRAARWAARSTTAPRPSG